MINEFTEEVIEAITKYHSKVSCNFRSKLQNTIYENCNYLKDENSNCNPSNKNFPFYKCLLYNLFAI